MRTSKKKKGHTAVDNIVLDVILPTLPPSAQLVFLKIYRQTKGWHKETDSISNSQFCKATGYSDPKVIMRAVKELQARELITVEAQNTKIKRYGINWETVYSFYACGEMPQDLWENATS